MAVPKRSVSAGAVRKTLLLLTVGVCPGMACKSTGAAGESRSPQAEGVSAMCPAELHLPQQTVTFTVSCEGFTPEAQKIVANGPVTFVSTCDEKPVIISFSNPKTLFTNGVESISLPRSGESWTGMTTDVGDCHELCFDSEVCPPPDHRDSKTGSLDVYTSGPGPEPKTQSPQ